MATRTRLELTEEQRTKVLMILKLGGTCSDAADEVRVGRKSLKNYVQAHPDFERDMAQAQAKGKMRHIRKIYNADDWRASAWWLGIRYQSEFGNPNNPPAKAGDRGGVGFAENLIKLKRQLANLMRKNDCEHLIEQVCEIVDGTTDPDEVTKVVLDLGDGAVTKS